MLPASFFILIVAGQCIYGFALVTPSINTKESGHPEDVVTDLKRLSSIPKETKRLSAEEMSEEKLDGLASANLHSVLLGANHHGTDGQILNNYYEKDKVVPEYDSSRFMVSKLMPGKRRFDDDSIALASTGQSRGNRLIFLDDQLLNSNSGEMLQTKATNRATNRRQRMPRLDNQQYGVNTNRNQMLDQAMNNNRQYNRRSLVMSHHMSARKSGGDIGGISKVRGRQNRQQQQARRRSLQVLANQRVQESRERAMKPLVNDGRRGSKKVDQDDDVFNDSSESSSEADDDNTGSSDRRSDSSSGQKKSDGGSNDSGSSSGGGSGDDDDDEDETSEEDDKPRQRASRPRAQQANNRRHKAASQPTLARQGYSKVTDDGEGGGESMSSKENIDDDEDTDSTNASPIKGPVSGTKLVRLVEVEGQENEGLDNKNSLESDATGLTTLDNNNDDDNDSSSSSNHLKHSSTDLQTAAGHHHGHHDHYYQYVEVPKKKAWKFGFKRGNHKHTSK